MIEKFEIRNFKSILDVEIDFKYGEGAAPRHYLDHDTWAFLKVGNDKNYENLNLYVNMLLSIF